MKQILLLLGISFSMFVYSQQLNSFNIYSENDFKISLAQYERYRELVLFQSALPDKKISSVKVFSLVNNTKKHINTFVFNSDGFLISDFETKEILAYNDNGSLINKYIINADSLKIKDVKESCEYTYLENGLLDKKVCQDMSVNTYNYEYNSENLITRIFEDKNNYTEFIYDESKRISRCLHKNVIVTSSSNYYYDSAGKINLIKDTTTYTSINTTLIYNRQIEYDTKGRVNITKFNANDKNFIHKFEYNNEGCVSKFTKIKLTSQGDSLIGSWGFEYKYRVPNITINGKVLNCPEKEITFLNQIEKSEKCKVKVNADGTFLINTHITKADSYSILFGNVPLNFICKPGDKISVYLDFNDASTLKLSGSPEVELTTKITNALKKYDNILDNDVKKQKYQEEIIRNLNENPGSLAFLYYMDYIAEYKYSYDLNKLLSNYLKKGYFNYGILRLNEGIKGLEDEDY